MSKGTKEEGKLKGILKREEILQPTSILFNGNVAYTKLRTDRGIENFDKCTNFACEELLFPRNTASRCLKEEKKIEKQKKEEKERKRETKEKAKVNDKFLKETQILTLNGFAKINEKKQQNEHLCNTKILNIKAINYNKDFKKCEAINDQKKLNSNNNNGNNSNGNDNNNINNNNNNKNKKEEIEAMLVNKTNTLRNYKQSNYNGNFIETISIRNNCVSAGVEIDESHVNKNDCQNNIECRSITEDEERCNVSNELNSCEYIKMKMDLFRLQNKLNASNEAVIKQCSKKNDSCILINFDNNEKRFYEADFNNVMYKNNSRNGESYERKQNIENMINNNINNNLCYINVNCSDNEDNRSNSKTDKVGKRDNYMTKRNNDYNIHINNSYSNLNKGMSNILTMSEKKTNKSGIGHTIRSSFENYNNTFFLKNSFSSYLSSLDEYCEEFHKRDMVSKINRCKNEENFMDIMQKKKMNEALDAFKVAVLKKKKLREQTAIHLKEKAMMLAKESDDEIVQECIKNCYQASLLLYLRSLRKMISTDEFEVLRLLGQGGYGTVYKVRYKPTGQIYALKRIPKCKLFCRNSRIRQLAERNVLAELRSPYIVRLEEAFQDNKYLYQLLEFLDGGNLLDWMHKKRRFSEECTKFYIAELSLAVQSVHQLGYVHRDIKPDNIVLTSSGHLKLLDFGLAKYSPMACILNHPSPKNLNEAHNNNGCYSPASTIASLTDRLNNTGISSFLHNSKHMSNARLKTNKAVEKKHNADPSTSHMNPTNNNYYHPDVLLTNCGTVMYTAPEVLKSQPYNSKVDWWAVGVIMFEALYGGVPFYVAPHPSFNEQQRYWHTVNLVLNFKKSCPIPYPLPDAPQISPEAIDLLKNLICDAECRFKGEEVMNHSWFKGIKWNELKDIKSPLSKESSVPDRSCSLSSKSLPYHNNNLPTIYDLTWSQYDFSRSVVDTTPKINEIIKTATEVAMKKKSDININNNNENKFKINGVNVNRNGV